MPMPMTTPTRTATPSRTESPRLGAAVGQRAPSSHAFGMPTRHDLVARQGGDAFAFDEARVVLVRQAETQGGAVDVGEHQRARMCIDDGHALDVLIGLLDVDGEAAAVGPGDLPLAFDP